MNKKALIVLCLIMIIVGWFANEIVQTKNVNAAKTIEYKVMHVKKEIEQLGNSANTEPFEKILNTYAKQGWKLHPQTWGSYLIFER